MPSHRGLRCGPASVRLSPCAALWLCLSLPAAAYVQENTAARAETAPARDAGVQAKTGTPAPASAQPAAADTARREIIALIAALGASGCEFQRNGTWHDAATARAHLQRKYDYLRKRDLAPSAESFVERAASRSSISGKAYRVRCPGRAEQPSADWFLQRLRTLRAPGSNPG